VICAWALVCCADAIAPVARAAPGGIFNLGTNGAGSHGQGLNADAQVVGYYSLTSTGLAPTRARFVTTACPARAG